MKKKTQKKAKPVGFVQETIGQAQRRLTLMEGEARKFVTGTWTRVIENSPIGLVEATLDQWRQRYTETVDVDKLSKRLENVSSEYSIRAFHTVGLATRKDIKTVERKIDRLRSDLRKINGKGKKKTAAKTTRKARR